MRKIEGGLFGQAILLQTGFHSVLGPQSFVSLALSLFTFHWDLSPFALAFSLTSLDT